MENQTKTLRLDYTTERMHVYRSDGQLILTQNARPDTRPFIHPIVAPDGQGYLTEDAPPHHPWQHGLYVGIKRISGIGFWEEGLRNKPTDGSFHPRALTAPVVQGNTASWSVETEWRSPDATPMLHEYQAWTLRDEGMQYLLDLKWSLTAVTDLTVEQASYGGLFLRMPYDPERGGTVLSSEGKLNQEAEGQRARWVAVSMPVPGRQDSAGLALLDHPGNREHPVPWRVDGELGISPSPSIAGAWNLKARQADIYRYRLLVFLGEPQTSIIERAWQAFSEEP